MDALHRLVNFYRIQLGLILRWRKGTRALVRHTLVSFVVAFVSLVVTAWILPGIHINDAQAAAVAVLLFWAFNLLVRPIIIAILAPISAILVVIAALLLQVAVFLLLGPLVPGVEVDGFWSAFIGSWIFAIVNTILTAIFSISDDDSQYGALVRQLRMSRRDVTRTTDPGLVVIQIDGLSHDVLKQQLHAGRAPFMTSWIRGGSHRLTQWEAMLPSQTSASQAGIMHGNNDGIPAFRWWDKETNRLLVSNHPADTIEIVRRISNGEGLLSNGGASINNLASGDATRSFLTMATIKLPGGGVGDSQAFANYFISPYNYLHMVVRFFGESIKEVFQARRQIRAGIEPRMHRGFPYPFVRAATNVILRDLGISLVMGEMYRGTPVVYIDFTDYDEIAHHSGPERSDALDALDGVDRCIATLWKGSQDAARPYRFIVVSDHGQTLGATFLQRYGISLEGLVNQQLKGTANVEAATTRVEEYGPLNTFAAELRGVGGITGGVARAMTGGKADKTFGPDDVTTVGKGPAGALAKPKAEQASEEARTDADGTSEKPPTELPEVVVCASGNLGLISFPREAGRVTLATIDAKYKGLVDALTAHEGIGFILLATDDRGPIVLSNNGIRYLDGDKVEGQDPLAPYGDLAADKVRRVHEMTTCPDILVLSTYYEDSDEVAAFEELIGSHGGLGGSQTRPFLLYPSEWELDGPILGAPAVYTQIRRWIEGPLGLKLGPQDGTAAKATAEEDRTPAPA
jgi:uncharacterized membrane protein YvlD (DUF360 family)